jgi:hypothetical protein
MTFNIGSQRAQTINNAGRDQYVQQTVSDADPRLLLQGLREALADAHLPPSVAAQARAHLDGTEADLADPQPDKSSIADRLQRLTKVLVAAGSVVSATTPLGAPLAALAGWLGTLGEPVRERLG